MDKTEVLLQHDEADIKYLNKKEIPFNLYYGAEFHEHDKTLKLFRKVIDSESVKLYKDKKIDEKLYKKYEWIAMPRITDVKADVAVSGEP